MLLLQFSKDSLSPSWLKVLLASLVMLVYDIILEPVAEKMDMWHGRIHYPPAKLYCLVCLAFLFHSILKWSGNQYPEFPRTLGASMPVSLLSCTSFIFKVKAE